MVVRKPKQASKTGWVPVADLCVDIETQRTLTPGWVRTHVDTFDVDKLGHIVVNIRDDGKMYVVDGQHRVALMREVGWGDQKIEAEIFSGLSREEEAELFLARNDRKAVRKFDKFRVSCTAGHDESTAILRIVQKAGLVLSDQTKDGNISAVAALERIYRGAGIASEQEGARALAAALSTSLTAWGKNSNGFAGDVIQGIGLFHLRYNGKVDQKALAQKLSTLRGGPAGLLGNARALKEVRGRPVPHCVASIIVDVYNKQRRTGMLEDWEMKRSSDAGDLL